MAPFNANYWMDTLSQANWVTVTNDRGLLLIRGPSDLDAKASPSILRAVDQWLY